MFGLWTERDVRIAFRMIFSLRNSLACKIFVWIFLRGYFLAENNYLAAVETSFASDFMSHGDGDNLRLIAYQLTLEDFNGKVSHSACAIFCALVCGGVKLQ